MASTSNLKVHYFDEDGRAEVSRLILVLAGKTFDDVRISFDDWPQVKPSMPLGQVPVLEVDGTKFPQSLAIAAYLARELNLYGKTNLDGLKIDAIAHTVFEMRIKASRHYYEKDATKKTALASELTSKEAPFYLDYLEKVLINNGGKFIVGDSLSLADVIVYDLLKGALGKFTWPNIEKYPNLKGLVETFSNIDAVKQYHNQ